MSRLLVVIGLVVVGWFLWTKYGGGDYLGGLGTGSNTPNAVAPSQLY